jgi:Protein of unknown function (DUF2905)
VKPDAGMHDVGRLLVVLGVLIALVGAGLLLAGRIPWLGRLPGDVVVHRGPLTVYFPIVTSIVLSILLTILVNVFWRR